MTDGALVSYGFLALISLSIGVASLVVLHVSPTGCSPVRDAVSNYGVGRYASGYRAQVVAIGVAAALEALAFAHDAAAGTAGIVWLVVYAVSRVAIAWAPTDLPGAERTRTGRAHALLAVVAFTSIAVATSTIPNGLREDASWTSWADLLNVLGTLVVVTAIATAAASLVTPLRSMFGAVERSLYVASLVWLATAAIACIAVGW